MTMYQLLKLGPQFPAIAILFFILGYPTSVSAEEPLPLLNAAYLTFPPMAYTDEQGNARGSIIELTNELAADSGYRIHWINYPINRIYRSLSNGNIALWPGSQHVPALADFTLESKPLDYNVKLCAFSFSGSTPLTSTEDLIDKQLVLIRGYTYRGQLKAVFDRAAHQPIVAPDHTAAMQLLATGRAEYLISYGHPMQESLANYPLQQTHCDKLGEWPLVFVVSRRNPDAQQIADNLDAAYQRYVASQQQDSQPEH